MKSRLTLPALKQRLSLLLKPPRYHHSLSTAQFAARLAQVYGASPNRAYLAGLLHDCARDLPPEELRQWLHSYHGKYADSLIRRTPALWHNPVSVIFARRKWGITDPGVLRAIGRHSTGGAHMKLLDKVVYVADYCEPRRPFSDAPGLRALALRDLDQAVAAVTRGKLDYLKKKNQPPHPWTLALARELGLKDLGLKGQKVQPAVKPACRS